MSNKSFLIFVFWAMCSLFNCGLHAQDEPSSYLKLMQEITAYHVKLSKIDPEQEFLQFVDLKKAYYRNVRPKWAVLAKIIDEFHSFRHSALCRDEERMRQFKKNKDGSYAILNAFCTAIKNHDDHILEKHLKALINLTEASLGGNYFWVVSPAKREPHVFCNVLEYALYHQNYVAFHYVLNQIFACALGKDQLKNQEENRLIKFLNEDFLVSLLQDPEQARFVEVLRQSECGHIKLADLLRYLVENRCYKEIAVLLELGVSANSLFLKHGHLSPDNSDNALVSIIGLAFEEDQDDIIGLSLLDNYHAHPKPDETWFHWGPLDRWHKKQRLESYNEQKVAHVVDQIRAQVRSFLLKMHYPESDGNVLHFLEQRSLGFPYRMSDKIDVTVQQDCAEQLSLELIDDPVADEIEKKMATSYWDFSLSDDSDDEDEGDINLDDNPKKYQVSFKKFVKVRGVNALIKGYTLLELTCKYQSRLLFKWLIHQGAHPTDRALRLASDSGFHEGIAALVAVGQNPDAMVYDPRSQSMSSPLEEALTYQVPQWGDSWELLFSLGACQTSAERTRILNCIDIALKKFRQDTQDPVALVRLVTMKRYIFDREIEVPLIVEPEKERMLRKWIDKGKQLAEVWRKRLAMQE